LKQSHQRVDEKENGHVEHGGDSGYKHKRHVNVAAELFRVAASEMNGKQRTASQTQPELDGIEKHHQCIGRSNGGQRTGTDEAAYDERVRQVVALLQQVAEHQRKGEAQHPFGYVSGKQTAL
jgi:hypothetical protein